MWNKKSGFGLLAIALFLAYFSFVFVDEETPASEIFQISSEEHLNPFKRETQRINLLLAADGDSHDVSSPELRKQRLKFMLKVGTGPNSLGISLENTKIGPGLIKRLRNGYLIADTFNNRILKLNDEGDVRQTLSFPASSLIQGAAENSRGELSVLRKEDKKLHLDIFDEGGDLIQSNPIQVTDEEVLHYAGTFRSFYSNDELYISNGTKVLRVSETGQSTRVPGIPLGNSQGLYVATRKSTGDRFIVDIKDESNQAVKSFYTKGDYDSLKNVYTDNKNQIHVEFEHVYEGYSSELSKNISTKSTIVETYDQNGKLIQDNILESTSDAEIDQSLDIDEDGNLNNLVYEGGNFKVYELMT